MEFKDLGIRKELLQAINELGFTTPTAIQQQAIPTLLAGDKDFIGLAQTGTGKTAAFGLPLISAIDTSSRDTQALILCPTRELCLQIAKELTIYAKHMSGIKIVPIYGGAAIETQMSALRKGVHIVVGTPGRTLDHIARRTLKLNKVRIVVLDEADEMLNMGFQEDINKILSETPAEKRTWLFSATMPHEVAKIAQNYMEDPVKVTIGSRNSSATNIEHLYSVVKSKDSYDALKRFIDYSPGLFGILFCRTRRDTKEIVEKLIRDGYNADALHGDLSQSQRDTVMKKFRNKKLQLLVATDVAARGIDVSNVTHVIHYNIPEDIENYTHRSGRTARAGKSGISLAILNTREVRKIKTIEREIGQPIRYVPVPTGADVCQKQLYNFIDMVKKVVVDKDNIQPYLPTINQALHDLSREELITHFVSLEFNRYLHAYSKAPNLNPEKHEVEHADREEGAANRLFINVGTIDGFDKKEFLTFLCDYALIEPQMVGNITIKPNFTFFSINDPQVVEKVIKEFKGKSFDGRRIRVELSSPAPRGGRRSDRSGGRYHRGEGSYRRDGGSRRRF